MPWNSDDESVVCGVYMEKVWLQSYPAGVPATIDADAYRSLGEVFQLSVQRYADKPAFICMGGQLSFRELGDEAAHFAAYLQNDLKLPRGARVALMMPNILQYPVAMFGALLGGYTVVNVNPLYTARELEHQLRDSGAEAIVIVENFAAVLQKVLPAVKLRQVIVTKLGDLLPAPRRQLVNFVVRHVKKMVPAWEIAGAQDFRRVLECGRQYTLQAPDVGPEDIAYLQYTGGTTGVAKGAVLTHRNIIANLQQATAWIRPVVEEGREVIITALPLYHIFSLTANCLTFFGMGGTNVLITNPRDITGFIKELRKHRFTAMTGVNTLFNALLNHPEFATLDFSSLRLTLGGGMAVQQKVAEDWQRVTGSCLSEAYGLTETSPAVTINPLTFESFNHSIGLPVPSTEISLRDDEGNEVPLGEAGELCVRGPQVMREYWQRPEETARVFTADGFLRTGDIASIDEKGFVRLVDRKKDMILVSGFNVYPNEIEDVVVAHPGVLEVAAVGVPDAQSGEAVKLFVVRKDPGLTREDIIAHCRKNLTAYKVPRTVEFREELPKTNVGKILRRQLRDEAAAEQAVVS